MAEDSHNIPYKGEKIHAQDIWNALLDPTANTTVACVGYDQDILGGY